jgi:acetoacetyl-CoA reductase
LDLGNQHQPKFTVQHVPSGDRRHALAQVRPHYQHLLDERSEGAGGPEQLFCCQGGELGFTKALAQENARSGITVNAICPGYIATEMVKAVPQDVMEKSILPQIPLGRLGEPEEIARCVVFLASDDAGFITGSTLSVNGGQVMV